MQKAVALAFSVVYLLSVGRGSADFTVRGRVAPRRQKAERAVPLQRPSMDTIPAKRDGSCLKDWLN